jgi:hypothetical protein
MSPKPENPTTKPRMRAHLRIPQEGEEEDTISGLSARAGDLYQALNALLTEKCFCYYTVPSLTSLPAEAQGPRPPIVQVACVCVCVCVCLSVCLSVCLYTAKPVNPQPSTLNPQTPKRLEGS